MMQLTGKTAIITGAGSGVGRASALHFAKEGANVVCADINEEWLAKTVGLVTQAGGKAIGTRCDVSNEDDVAAAVRTAIQHFKRLDIMFNNAAITGFQEGKIFEDTTADDWKRLNDINFRGVFFGCKFAVKQFKLQKSPGVIVNTGSIAGMVGWGNVAYGATKGGVNQLTRGLAIECAPFDIRVNAICPAAMPHTNFSITKSEEEKQQLIADAAAYHPLGRVIMAEDCAAAAAFLASDQAKNITGVLLPIDGGYTAR
jgi:NAD(P)-dependent dehydrogenase (short-subunit alcohol dehydrogenase family)